MNINITRNLTQSIIILVAAVTALNMPAKANESPIHDVIEAHGGLDRWQSLGTFQYTMDGFPLSPQTAQVNTSTVNLRTRANRIESAEWTVGFDGTTGWALPEKDAAGLPTRFFNLGSFYFIGMPYVFADPGVTVKETESQKFRGKTYRVLNVSYGDGIGHTAEDEYQLFIDPESNQLALINHSVTETGVERVTWTFDEWQEVNGLLVPAKMTFYPG
jgi:hypothetical protein